MARIPTATLILALASVLIAIVLMISGFATAGQVMLLLGGNLLVVGLAVRVMSPTKKRQSRSGSLPYLLIAIIWTFGALMGLAIVVLVITHHVTSGAAYQVALGSLAFVVCSFVGTVFFVTWLQIRKSAGQQA